MNLTDNHLIAMHVLTMYKPSHRREYLEEWGIAYSPSDPTIASLVTLGFCDVNARGAIQPDRKRIKAELALHHAPMRRNARGNTLENASLAFKRRPPSIHLIPHISED